MELPKSIVDKIIQMKSEMIFHKKHLNILKDLKKFVEGHKYECTCWDDPPPFYDYFLSYHHVELMWLRVY